MARRSRRCTIPIVLAVMLPLVACQRAGTMQRADGWERPEPFGAADAVGQRHGAGLPDPLPLASHGRVPPSSRDSAARALDLSFADPAAWPSGNGALATGSLEAAYLPDVHTAGTAGPSAIPAPGGGRGEDVSSTDWPTASTTSPATASTTTTTASGSRLAEHSLDNATAADLLDHWGHRRVQGLVEGLSLRSPGPEADAADLAALRAAASATGDLRVGAEVRVLGTRRGVTWGRWTDGPADTLSITFDLSAAGPVMRSYPGFRAMAERAGKAWSHGIADTWAAWHRPEGAFRGWLIDGPGSATRVYVGAGGEVSTGLVIDLRDDDVAGNFSGWAQMGDGPPGESWQPRFAPLELDRDFLRDYPREDGESRLFAVLVHEIGHTLGAWQGGSWTHLYGPFTDTEAGTWSGPGVVAVHGEAAPFQDASDPYAWVDGERSPLATRFDFAHSGVCDSIMAYCSRNAPRRALVPHAIDFAFLADLGMTVPEETGSPETYGLAGWTGHAGFTLAVSRDLRIDIAGAQSDGGSGSGNRRALDVTDRFEVEADAFGHASTGSLALSYPAKAPLGTVRYAGGLVGAAIDRDWMPPVTGDAALAVDLGTLDGTASFTSLAVHTGGASETFAGGALHYAFALDGNAIVGTDTDSTLLADFYGPRHEDAAGTLHDPDAGLLASFGATYDGGEDGAGADEESGETDPASAEAGADQGSGETDPASAEAGADQGSGETDPASAEAGADQGSGETDPASAEAGADQGSGETDSASAEAGADQGSGETDLTPPVAGAVTGMRAPTVRLEGIRHVGATDAAEAGALTSATGRNGVAVSSGEVRDGESAGRVVEYLAEHTRDGGFRFGRTASGLLTFAEPPTLRLARGTSEEIAAYAMRAVGVVNAALPADRRIVIGSTPAPAGASLGSVPDGEIFVDFTPSAGAWSQEHVDPRARYFHLTTYVDPNEEFDPVAQRLEDRSMRAARVWTDGRDIAALLRTAWVWNADTEVWEVEVLDSPVVESTVVRKYYTEEFANGIIVRELLRAMGFLGDAGQERFPDSVLAVFPSLDTWHLPTIDADALLAAYGRLEPGTEPEDLSPDSLGPWSDTSFHLRGDLALAGGQAAAFGVALRNGLARPWALGPEPLAGLADNTALFGTVTWNGALAGVTPAEETVAGDARLAVEIATLEGRLDFTGLERWGVRAAPGAVGTGTTWGDGDLGYSIRVEGNAFVRAGGDEGGVTGAFVQTGGDEGEVTGAFFGRAHEAMGGVLQRSDLSAGFGGTR